MPRQRDYRKEHAILDAAQAEVLEHGLEALSMDAVARRAGVATGTVYRYFANKIELVGYLYVLLKSSTAAPFFDDAGLPVREGFEKACREFIRECCAHVADEKFVEQIECSDAYTKRIEEELPMTFDTPTALLDRGKEEGVIKDIDSELLVEFISNALRPFGRKLEKVRDRDREAPIRDILSLCWGAIAASDNDA